MQNHKKRSGRKVVLFANTDWYLYNFRLSLANTLREMGYEVVMLSPDGPYGQKLCELGFRWERAPLNRRSLNPFREIGFVWWLSRFFRRESPTIVHSFTIKCAVYGAFAGRVAGVPARVNAVAGMGYVFTSRDAKARVLRPILRQIMRLTLNAKRSMLILQNPDDVRLFKSAGLVDEDRIRLIKGSGVNCRRFVARGWDHGEKRPLRVLLAARLQWDKGIAEYVEAARTLIKEGRDVRFFLAGGVDKGNPAVIDESIVREWVDEGVLEWLGHVDDMAKLFPSMDVMALPSYREGLPKGLIEAGACALALVTTDVPGCREVVQNNGVDGLLIEVRNAHALAEAIRQLDDDRMLARSLGLKAREKALVEFDEEKVIAATIGVYEELV
ncbi:glycosyltransferase family 4 protein [Burkholderia pseudomultivorans]|uniref:N, N'-diacetylbacillosaminyl-diphospho-undecaprenol alpha-1,3-N-acetylgalactosaminyltransferase n=1 Tax=Burkholderia pseudomultivorans TaxID=1207504 RepID=A0ABU2E249_9BURK|nr:glycosyltransferase family 4 protein [Burkholderia pseudomultivorans]MDR8726493.1 N,N'-diacetylbacillosaminyl-diphospho-undecaprenol alpha-1,3-N-acetylgalactosaminyltransferase [Burkholderia pseudomultivorans]MDR8736326.1 N,N'-diacetylbacillosaminyl-diphospho-undecaprenol alpha-1,3-N-acetylgalactosaminyltransferase [Burkholderia pseudomultivorans]MDR8742140.1 N,N'-diacetylbacillosaminyl-diphospho-undecaprenol alpha-1,3-N-acetylgalactosaminyltransferase [Burkholderia pseudomultivorans]MDR8753